MKINIENLNRAIALMETIPEERINMSVFRGDLEKPFTHICQSNGCVIGFCAELDTKKNLERFTLDDRVFSLFGNFLFSEWSEHFFGVKRTGITWIFLFAGSWPNDKEQIIKRLQWVVDGNDIPSKFYQGQSVELFCDKELNYELTLS